MNRVTRKPRTNSHQCACGKEIRKRAGLLPAQCRTCRLNIVKLPVLKCACGRRIWQRRGREPYPECVKCRREADSKTITICKCGSRVHSADPSETQCSKCRPRPTHYSPVSMRHVPPTRFENVSAENVFQAMSRGAK